jgi:hypothetical protein
MHELARVRELTFRRVGEGTGRRLDSDRFDDWYDQIVLWDSALRRIAGGYRVAPCARVLDERGAGGLYTASLFRFDGRVLPVLERGMELGRSFVVPDYWGTRSLEYLWTGIGAYLRRHPHVRYLFGPVSVSASLPAAAREWVVAYYSRFFGDRRALARSHVPFRFSGIAPDFGACDAEAAMILLRDRLTALGARVPTLYRQYTELCSAVRGRGRRADPGRPRAHEGEEARALSRAARIRRDRRRGMNAAARIEMPPRHRAVFISDTHIGSPNCQAEALAEFLATLRCACSRSCATSPAAARA